MLLGGDEIGRTQRGNNNAYCQDNELTWLDWQLDRRARDFLSFTRTLIALRRRHPVLRRRQFFFGRHIRGSEVKDLTWFRPDGREMVEEDWGNPHTRCLGLRLSGDAIDELTAQGDPVVDDTFLILLNGHYAPVSFVTPGHRAGIRWEALVDTRAADGRAEPRGVRAGDAYELVGRSLAILRQARTRPPLDNGGL